MKKKVILHQLTSKNTSQKFTVAHDEHLTLILLAHQETTYTTQVILQGENAQADILGIVLGHDANEIQINTLQDHQAPHTVSNLLIKSALTGRSQLHYEGFIKVEKNAQQTNAYQRNENLMLSPEAKAETKPALEILANDVRCTHSATIGKVDPEELFYLQTRGIAQQKATRLIVAGFFAPILDKIEDKKVKGDVEKRIKALL